MSNERIVVQNIRFKSIQSGRIYLFQPSLIDYPANDFKTSPSNYRGDLVSKYLNTELCFSRKIYDRLSNEVQELSGHRKLVY